jgi:hypothetical protein
MTASEILHYKSNFIVALRPFLDMLRHQKHTVPVQDWLMLVDKLRKRVILNPEQYLSSELPFPEITSKIAHEIFEEFVNENISVLEETFR